MNPKEISTQVQARGDKIAELMPNQASQFMTAVGLHVATNQHIAGCTEASVLKAVMDCATLRLIPDGREAAIVAFKQTATLIPMYTGLLKLANASGKIKSIQAEVVCQADEFDYELGDNPRITHKPAFNAGGRGPAIGAYCIIQTTDGGVYREVMDSTEIAAVEATARSRAVWTGKFRNEMIKKTVLRRALKRFPMSDPHLAAAFETDNDNHDFSEPAVETTGDIIDAEPDDVTPVAPEAPPPEPPAQPAATKPKRRQRKPKPPPQAAATTAPAPAPQEPPPEAEQAPPPAPQEPPFDYDDDINSELGI